MVILITIAFLSIIAFMLCIKYDGDGIIFLFPSAALFICLVVSFTGTNSEKTEKQEVDNIKFDPSYVALKLKPNKLIILKEMDSVVQLDKGLDIMKVTPINFWGIEKDSDAYYATGGVKLK